VRSRTFMISLTTNSVSRGIPPVVPGPVRMQDGPRHQLPRIFVGSARGGTGVPISYPVVLIMQGRGQAVQEICLSPSCTAALGHAGSGQRRRPPCPARSPAQGWRVRPAAGIRPADPFSAWIRRSVQAPGCGIVCSASTSTGLMPGGVCTCNYCHFRTCVLWRAGIESVHPIIDMSAIRLGYGSRRAVQWAPRSADLCTRQAAGAGWRQGSSGRTGVGTRYPPD